MNTLYHYVHCPFCVRIRMTCGFLNLNYTSVVLSYDDETTPINLIGKKMLPIWKDKEQAINESLDIMVYIDKKNQLQISKLKDSAKFHEVNNWLNILSGPIHNLAMPYFIYTPEFNDDSRLYFKNKKEAKRGPFSELIQRRNDLENTLSKQLEKLENNLKPWFLNDEFSMFDILLASHLWGMYIVPEFQFSGSIHSYLQRVKQTCHFDYHQDYWVIN